MTERLKPVLSGVENKEKNRLNNIGRYFEPIPGKTKMVEVRWHDYEDDCSLRMTINIPINADPENEAIGFLMEYIPGKYYFESVRELIKDETKSILEARIFEHYKKRELVPSSRIREFMMKPLSSIKNVSEKADGQNTLFEDREIITYFYDLSSVNPLNMQRLDTYTDREIETILVLRERGSNIKPIGGRLNQLIGEGRNVTHIVSSLELYGGGTNESVYREYLEAQVFIVGSGEVAFVKQHFS